MVKEYVLNHVRIVENGIPKNKVLVVHKLKPLWQNGKLNLTGGKVESGEHYLAAAVRELNEETGYEPVSVCPCGQMHFDGTVIHCLTIDILDTDLNPGKDEQEKFEWLDIEDALSRPNLMINLKLLIPLLHLKVTGWFLYDKNDTLELKLHGI